MQTSHEFEDATFALHRIGLPEGAPILQHLVKEPASNAIDSACLEFELFDCFEEEAGIDDLVCFKGTLQVQRIFEAAKVDLPEVDKVWPPGRLHPLLPAIEDTITSLTNQGLP